MGMPENEKGFIDQSARKRVYAIIDETNTNNDDKGRRNIFCVGAVITDRPEEFAKLSSDLRAKLGSPEVKYKNNRGNRNGMEESMSALGTYVIGRYVEKEKRVPPWLGITARRHTALLEDLVKDLIDLNVDFERIVIDDDSSLHIVDKEGRTRYIGREIIESGLKEIRNVSYITQEDSRKGINADLIQTADFAIGAMGRILREENSVTKMDIRVKRHE